MKLFLALITLSSNYYLFSQNVFIEKIKLYSHDSMEINNRFVTAEKCFTIDATQSIDEYNPNLEFHWDFNSELKKGIIVDFCAKDYGIHYVKLTVLDPVTQLKIREVDSSFKVELQAPSFFSMMDKKSIELTNHFIYHPHNLSYKFLSKGQKIVWKINELYFYENQTKYIFNKVGNYEIQCFIFNENNEITKSFYEKIEIKNPK